MLMALEGPGRSGCHQTIIFKAFEAFGYTNVSQTIVFIAFEKRSVAKPLYLQRLKAMAVRHVSQTIMCKAFKRFFVAFERRDVTKPVCAKRLEAMAIRHVSQTIVFYCV